MLDALKEFWALFEPEGMLGAWLWPGLLALTCVLCLCFGAGTLIKSLRKKLWIGDTLYFIILCAAVMLWGTATLLPGLGIGAGQAALLGLLANFGRIFVPCMLVLHVQKQVSYKDMTPFVVIGWLLVPAVLAARLAWGLAAGTGSTVAVGWNLLFYAYVGAGLVRCYMMCFNVLYQVPRHMRSPAYRIILAVTVVLAASLLPFFRLPLQGYNLPILVTGAAAGLLYQVLTTSSSANLVATSRDFVFGSQATMVLVLSNTLHILDWNKKEKNAHRYLPYPRYRESFENYKARILKEGEGHLSPHGENIMLTTKGGECQFLITVTEIRNNKRRFGYLAEINEVSTVYSTLRLFEDIATVDQMTSLLNRNAYLRAVQRYIEAGTLPLCIIIGDVNHLKRMNDTLGHLVGDRLLKTISTVILAHLPAGAEAFRIGGDEFVLLLPGGSAADAEGFIRAVDADCAIHNDPEYGTPSISWGHALRSDAAQEYNEAFALADKMMYAQKKERFQFTSSGMVPAEQHEAAGAPAQNNASTH